MTSPAASERKPVLFTFGNHMHWVDMQWLWGYHVLPGSVRDMLHLCREAGVKGNVNFDAIGYEKMAAECPEALAELREAVANGTIEPVGCSYGQPYGLFHGGESNIRQFTCGVRATLRLLGVRPRAFWEEEFYFFPQLPQILRSCGYTSANLFFQWTWHTPEVPRERCALIQWEGIDGTRIPALPRNELNLHQWPEDFEGLRHPGTEASRQQANESSLLQTLPLPAIVQWLELMPSKDWMCRSEVLLPKLKELLAHPDYAITPCTMSEMVTHLAAALVPPNEPSVRAYTMNDVWHGMTLGKNQDRHPKESRQCEAALIEAEAISALMGLLGRPYPRWDVYPSWELDEAWRDLLAAQHHDNHECEWLCGDIGYTQMQRAASLAKGIAGRAITTLFDRFTDAQDGLLMAVNPSGVTGTAIQRQHARYRFGDAVADVPPFGYRLAPPATADELAGAVQVTEDERTITLKRGELQVSIERETGYFTIAHPAWPDGVFHDDQPFPRFRFTIEGVPQQLSLSQQPKVFRDRGGEIIGVTFWLAPAPDGRQHLSISVTLDPLGGVGLTILDSWFAPPDWGLNGALTLEFAPAIERPRILADTPYACGYVEPNGVFRRKYPEGDWMTSPQWFESVERPFTMHRFVEFCDGEGTDARGVLVLTHGTQQWLRTEHGARLVVDARDPWDEHYSASGLEPLSVRIFPHNGMTNADRIRLATAFEAPPRLCGGHCELLELPKVFAPFDISGASNVIAHAFHRANEKDGEHLPDWAGHRMREISNGACTHPFMIRLVEWDGEPANVTLKLPGEIASAAKTNLMGEVGDPSRGWQSAETSEAHQSSDSTQQTTTPNDESALRGLPPATALRDTLWLTPELSTPPEWARDSNIEWSQVTFTMRPREIATIMADLVMGRKQFRDLDAKRDIWATVHRTGA